MILRKIVHQQVLNEGRKKVEKEEEKAKNQCLTHLWFNHKPDYDYITTSLIFLYENGWWFSSFHNNNNFRHSDYFSSADWETGYIEYVASQSAIYKIKRWEETSLFWAILSFRFVHIVSQ